MWEFENQNSTKVRYFQIPCRRFLGWSSPSLDLLRCMEIRKKHLLSQETRIQSIWNRSRRYFGESFLKSKHHITAQIRQPEPFWPWLSFVDAWHYFYRPLYFWAHPRHHVVASSTVLSAKERVHALVHCLETLAFLLLRILRNSFLYS